MKLKRLSRIKTPHPCNFTSGAFYSNGSTRGRYLLFFAASLKHSMFFNQETNTLWLSTYLKHGPKTQRSSMLLNEKIDKKRKNKYGSVQIAHRYEIRKNAKAKFYEFLQKRSTMATCFCVAYIHTAFRIQLKNETISCCLPSLWSRTNVSSTYRDTGKLFNIYL
jgi:hypothetical protein